MSRYLVIVPKQEDHSKTGNSKNQFVVPVDKSVNDIDMNTLCPLPPTPVNKGLRLDEANLCWAELVIAFLSLNIKYNIMVD